jgi:diguanylate cyclase (GGDEF)-like protein
MGMNTSADGAMTYDRSETITLTGYHITEQLYTGANTLVYRATRIADQSPVILKFAQSSPSSFAEQVQFQNQYTISQTLDNPGIIQTYDLATQGDRYGLVMEDFGGIALSQFTQQQPLDLSTFFAIALQLTDILHTLSQHQIIHKDIKPDNILIHPEHLQVKLIDFSVSSRLPREAQELQNLNTLEGTLPYLSPEQTGRMNRGIDYRSDFYSLGVTFYELLTGQLPFQSDDPMELVYCHLAKMPPPLHVVCPSLPVMLSEIVTKLMAKNVEERYQSALGLKHDLERCLHQWQQSGTISEFAIAQGDRSDRFLIPERLYGREGEVQTLLNAFDRVAKGSTELILVAGFSGIGKTAIINEVHKPIARQRGYFIKGKYDQFQRDIPFFAFVQAFRDLMGQLLSESDAQLAVWKQKILAAVGDSGQVVIDVIPELEYIIGPQPTVTELAGTAAQNRFNLLFQQFVQVFTQVEHPLVIFLDDLQWADSASLKLLQLLMQDAGHLLVLGAYRDNEVSTAHSFMQTVEEIRKTGALVQTITLHTLEQSTITQWVGDTLICDVIVAHPLAELVYQKTKGNPFFVTQFLKALHHDGWITFDPVHRYWQCNLSQIRTVSLTDDVVVFMMAQLRKLPAETQAMMQFAACIGAQVDLATLAMVSERSQAQVATALWPALQAGLMLPITETYKFFQGTEIQSNIEDMAVPYRFLHDRVQQAAYSLIAEADRPALHLKIGRLLLHNIPESEHEERIFDILGQLNRGIHLSQDHDEQRYLAQLNLRAGRKAKLSTAHASALTYFQQGIDLLPDSPWQQSYPLWLQLHTQATSAALLSGQFTKMQQFADRVLDHAQTFLDTIAVYEVLIDAAASAGRFNEAIDLGAQVVSNLGIHFPASPSPEDVQQALTATQLALGDRTPEDLVTLPEMNDPPTLAALGILAKISSAVYIARPQWIPLVICKEVELSARYGNAASSGFGYASYGLLLCGIFNQIEAGHAFGRLALQIPPLFADKSLEATTIHVATMFVLHWQQPLQEMLPLFKHAHTCGLEQGDFTFAGYSIYAYGYFSYLLGHDLMDLEQRLQTDCQLLEKIQQPVSLSYTLIYHQTVLNLLGKNEVVTQLRGEVFDATEMLPNFQATQDYVGLFHIAMNTLVLCYWFGDLEEAARQTQSLRQVMQAVVGMPLIAIAHFYDALTQLAIFPTVSSGEQEQILQQVSATLTLFKGWADHAPMNQRHRWHLLSAEYARVLGQTADAIDHYDAAIAQAQAHGYLQEEGLANELAAKFYLGWGKTKIAQDYLTAAYDCDRRWGATAKTQQLEKLYPTLFQEFLQPAALSEKTLAASLQELVSVHQTMTASGATLSNALDLNTLIKAGQALYSEIDLERLLSVLMWVIVENAGADKAALILNQDGILEVSIQFFDHAVQEILATPLDRCETLPISLLRQVSRSLQPEICDRVTAQLMATDSYFTQTPPKSLLCSPIVNQGRLIGVLYLENSLMEHAFTSDRVAVLNLLCAQAAVSLENARLYERLKKHSQQLEVKVAERTAELEKANQELYRMATLDGLTLVANRRYLNSFLDAQWEQHCLTQQSLSLLLCDIDEFKPYNDYYGHQAGDDCLKEIAQLLGRTAVRPRDLVARYGGEEFAIILPETDLIGARQVAERIASETQQLKFPHVNSAVQSYVTLSVGIASITPQPDRTWQQLIKMADQALYQAKRLGRDRYCVYHSELGIQA